MATEGKVSAEVAVTNVACLTSRTITDDQPSIEATAITLNYDVSFDCNFEDRSAFVLGISKYVEEAQSLALLNVILEQGFDYSALIYTWRACSRAIPAVKSNDQQNRIEIYSKTVEVMGPYIEKLKNFVAFQANAIEVFCREVKTLSNPERLKGFISQTTKLTLGRILNMFATLDTMKDKKACLSNDFSCFKRARSLTAQSTEIDHQQDYTMSNFLATQKIITTKLRDSLEAIEGYEDVLQEIIEECATLFENAMYVLPSEKHMMLKTMSYGLSLMDGRPVKVNLYKNKAINLARFDKIFKNFDIVPLFGDMSIMTLDFIKSSPRYAENEAKWSVPLSAIVVPIKTGGVEEKLPIVIKASEFQVERDAFMCDLALANSRNHNRAQTNMGQLNHLDLALRGIKLISNWSATVQELYAYKLANPTDKYKNRDCPESAEAYEKSTRYNYSNEEKTALIQIIAMIKTVSRELWKCESQLRESIRMGIHRETQTFVQHGLREVIRYCTKKKKVKARTVLTGMRHTCADWLNGKEPIDDPALMGEKDGGKYIPQAIPSRSAAPGITQLYMLRTMLESLCIDDKKKSLKHDLEKDHIKDLEAFYNRSWYYSHLENFSESLQEATDLSQLWYREFFLELTMGKSVQFPIEMSLPWILVDHILHNKDRSLMEFALFPLDLYNDSANFALTKFKKQYLFDEVEAEVDLAFDQFIFKLSELIFEFYKSSASILMLDGPCRSKVSELGLKIPLLGDTRFTVLLKQRHFQLLGRSVDINRLLAQRFNISLKKSIDLAISRFESGDLSNIIELDFLLTNCRITHELITAALVELDPFSEMLHEANEAVTSSYGRVTLHIFAEICTDIMRNWVYNTATKRFVMPENNLTFGEGTPIRGPEQHPNKYPQFWFGSKNLNLIYTAINDSYRGFVGPQHFECMARLLGYGNVAFCIEEMLKEVKNNLNVILTPYVVSLLDGMPKFSKLPQVDYGSQGALGFYQLTLKEGAQYKDLQTDVYQAFREIGNAIICFQMLEQNMTKEEAIDLAHAMPLQGVIPANIKEGEHVEEKLKEAEKRAATMRFARLLKETSDPMRVKMGSQADVLTKERICRGLCIFDAVLHRIKSYLKECDDQSNGVCPWAGPTPANKIMDIDECNQFHRLWSLIQYTFCVSIEAGSGTEAYFGDGLQWAGCTLISLLGQRNKFETLDFCYHIARIHDLDQSDKVVGTMNMRGFVEAIRQKRVLNDELFAVLDRYLSTEAVRVVDYYPPPVFQSAGATV